VQLTTTKSHRAFTLVGACFLLFELLFIQFFIFEYWFSIDLAVFGVPAVLSLMLPAHFYLRWLEGKSGCKFFSLIFKGTPPLAYEKWLLLEEDSFGYGNCYVRWDAVEELKLTIFGNLQVKSRIACGTRQEQPDVLLKFPFAITARENQSLFVARVRQHKPDVVTEKRLEKSLSAPQVKGASIGMASGAVVMFLVLLDVGWGSFWYLDIVKHYHLAAVEARDGKLQDAERDLKQADDIRNHPFPLSWVAQKFISQNSAAGLYGARSDALWRMGRRDEAVEDAEKAVEHAEHSTKVNLRLVRYLTGSGKSAEAKQVLEKVIEKHKQHLLPRIYLVAIERQISQEAAKKQYEKQHDQLVEEFFEQEPKWPPGGNLFFHDTIYQDDMDYVFKRLLGMPI
jgi:tetratricopeptide (TPR) repeat protein